MSSHLLLQYGKIENESKDLTVPYGADISVTMNVYTHISFDDTEEELLNEQAGANIRNEIAHGITSEYMASSGAYLYFAGAVIKLLTYTSIKCYELITTEVSKLKTFIEPGSDAIKIKRM